MVYKIGKKIVYATKYFKQYNYLKPNNIVVHYKPVQSYNCR